VIVKPQDDAHGEEQTRQTLLFLNGYSGTMSLVTANRDLDVRLNVDEAEFAA